MEQDLRRWFHITTHTYGAWLHGDPRGFRTRHHREHIHGDYKNPPPSGLYDRKLERSQRLMKQEPVLLSMEWRAVFGGAIQDKLQWLGAQVLCVSMGATHAHVLAKMPPGPVPRHWMGMAKKHSSFIGKDRGWTGKLWAVRSKVIPVKDRPHQLNALQYILDHIHEGAWVWDFRRGVLNESPGTAVPGLSHTPTESPGTAVPGLSAPLETR